MCRLVAKSSGASHPSRQTFPGSTPKTRCEGADRCGRQRNTPADAIYGMEPLPLHSKRAAVDNRDLFINRIASSSRSVLHQDFRSRRDHSYLSGLYLLMTMRRGLEP